MQKSGNDYHRSVARLHVSFWMHEQERPWKRTLMQTGAIACVLRTGEIITTAHSVAHSTSIEIEYPGRQTRCAARVHHLSQEMDLALLKLEGDAALEDVDRFDLGEIPTNSQVTIVTIGTDATDPVALVSAHNIVATTYVYSRRFLLALCASAGLPRGSSGAPAFSEGKLVGIAVQGFKPGDPNESTHFVPADLIRQFLADAQDGVIDGVPELGIFWQRIETPALAAYLQAPEKVGIVVSDIVYGSSAWGVLFPRDVVTAIDGNPVRSDATVALGDHSVHFTHLISRRQVGEKIRVELLRDAEPMETEIVLARHVALVPARPADAPTYLIFVGFVFIQLTYELLCVNGLHDALFRWKYYYFDELPTAARTELVILSSVIPHPLNAPYGRMYGVPLARVNGVRIRCMRDLATALEAPVGSFHVLEIMNRGERCEVRSGVSEYGNLIVLDAEEAKRAHEELLQKHEIAFDRSSDLR